MTDTSLLYKSPLSGRYSSKEMLYEYSEANKFLLWRKLWIWLAEAELALGANITQSQIEEMRQNINNIDIKAAIIEEQASKNEVAAHVAVFAKQCPKAAPIINLGATFFYISDNADLIVFRNSLDLLLPQLACIIFHLKVFAETYQAMPTLGFIHLQPTELTTVGRRACLWLQDLLMDELAIRRCRNDLRFLGIKGTIGTQMRILRLFNGDADKVKKLDMKIANFAGFTKVYCSTGQTYTRKVEVELLGALSSYGTTIHKICSDIRILAFRKVIEEPQDGTVYYKRYPHKSERCCSLARYLITVYASAAQTQAGQWLEGTLDDSAIRRLSIPEAFLCADAVTTTFLSIVKGIVVHPKVIDALNSEELPFMATHNIVNAMVKTGADKKVCESKIRALIHWATIQVKYMGMPHHLYKQIENDKYFEPIRPRLGYIFNEKNYTGRASEQVKEFIAEEVNPILYPYGDKVMLL